MVKVSCVSLSTDRIVKFAPPLMLIVCPIPPTNTFVNCEFTPVTIGEDVEHVTDSYRGKFTVYKSVRGWYPLEDSK